MSPLTCGNLPELWAVVSGVNSTISLGNLGSGFGVPAAALILAYSV
ncbi:hypothetical protein [Deinococcus sp.]|nr:hypothetical protein [Deinococcus sp.]